MILQRCGYKLKTLDLSITNISGNNLPSNIQPKSRTNQNISTEYTKMLPFIEVMKLYGTNNLTDNGLSKLVSLCGDTLKEVDILKTCVSKQVLDEMRTRGINVL